MPTIQELREGRGWTQAQLAAHTGVTRMAVWSWEANRRGISARQLKRLSEVFGVSMDAIDLPGEERPDGDASAR